MTTQRGLRDGFALPAALLAVIIVGGLVTGGVYAAMAEDRSSGNVQFGQAAFIAAERGMQELLGTKTRPYFEDEIGPVGAADTIGPVAITVGGVDAQYTLYVQRVATRLFLVESEGEVLTGGRYAGSKRRLAEMMRIHYTYVPKDRAITTQAGLRLRGQSSVTGTDTVPDTWSDCTSEGNQTGVVATDSTTIDVITAGGGGSTGVSGDPPIDEDATLDSAAFLEYGDMHLEELKAMAEKVYAPGTYNGMGPVSSGGVCDTSVKDNWGDPRDATGDCHLYWPIIYGTGNLNLQTGYGQGILIVDGDLHLAGNFEFAGLIFVYGAFTSAGTGNKVVGSLNVLGSSSTSSELQVSGVGDTRISLSSCAIERAHRYNTRFARPIPLSERRFIDMSGIGAF